MGPSHAPEHSALPDDDPPEALRSGAATTRATWLAERFPRELRASGLGLAYNGAAGLLGGTTPLACTTLAALTGSALAPGAYVAFACCASLAVAVRTGETAAVASRTRRRSPAGLPPRARGPRPART